MEARYRRPAGVAFDLGQDRVRAGWQAGSVKRRLLYALALVAAVALAAGLGWRMLSRTAASAALEVSQGEVEVSVRGPGTVQARVPVTVSARVSAQVVSLHADHGERVKRGQLLAVLDDRDLAARRAAAAAAGESNARNVAAAEASVAKAHAELELARNRERRDADLARAGFISQSAYEASALGMKAAQAAADNAAALLAARRAEGRAAAADARYAETLLSHTRVAAPMDALVIQRSVEPGSTVAPGSALFRLVDPATLWVAARIDEALLGRIEEGMPARIRLRNGEEHLGQVARISRQSDAATRELEVNVSFDTPPARFAIDQEAEVSILAGVERGPVVPVEALVRRDGRQGVMMLRGGREVFQPVRVGASDGRLAVIAEGLDQGEKLAAWTSR
jgi:RND family efflux transporter MFP subunit